MRNFIIYCPHGRCGSTLLASLLNSHPCIHCEGELLRCRSKRRLSRPISFLLKHFPLPYIKARQFRAHYVKQASAYGFKFFFSHLSNSPKIVKSLHASGWAVLYLRRDSIFDAVLSANIGNATKRWHGRKGKDGPEPPSLSVDPTTFLEDFRSRRQSSQHFHEILSSIPHLPIVYEDELASPECWAATVGRICNYLELESPPTPVTTHLSKPWSRPYSEIVSNYADLQSIAQQELAQGSQP